MPAHYRAKVIRPYLLSACVHLRLCRGRFRTAAIVCFVAFILCSTQGFARSPAPLFEAGITHSLGAKQSQVVQEDYPSCNKEPTDTDTLAAKSAYKVGQISFQEADYERAILYWEDAFTRDCTAHALLLNLARAYELNGQLERAVRALEAYILREPEAANKPAIEKRITKLLATSASLNAQADETVETEAAPAAEQPEVVERSARPLAPIFITAAGVVGATAGGILYGVSRSTLKQCSVERKTCGNAEATSKASRALGLRNSGYVLMAAGGAAVIAGAIYWTLSWQQTEAQEKVSRALVPIVLPGYQGVQFKGHF